MLKHQSLTFDGEKLKLTNVIDTDAHEKEAYEQFKLNPTGWNPGRKSKVHAREIPVYLMEKDPDLINMKEQSRAGNKARAMMYLYRFLEKNPGFRAAERR